MSCHCQAFHTSESNQLAAELAQAACPPGLGHHSSPLGAPPVAPPTSAPLSLPPGSGVKLTKPSNLHTPMAALHVNEAERGWRSVGPLTSQTGLLSSSDREAVQSLSRAALGRGRSASARDCGAGGEDRTAGSERSTRRREPAQGGRSSPLAVRDLRLQYDLGGILGWRAEDGTDGQGGRCPGGSAQQSAESAHHHGRRVRGGQAAQRRPRQRGAVPTGRRRGRRPRRGPADPLHPDPGVLLRERHQHPARQQPGPAGRAAAAGERAGPGGERRRRGTPGPALRAGDESTFITMEGSCPKSTYLFLPGKSLHGSVGSSD